MTTFVITRKTVGGTKRLGHLTVQDGDVTLSAGLVKTMLHGGWQAHVMHLMLVAQELDMAGLEEYNSDEGYTFTAAK